VKVSPSTYIVPSPRAGLIELTVTGRFWREAVVGQIAYLGYVHQTDGHAQHWHRASREKWLFVFNSDFLRAKDPNAVVAKF